ncbi:protein C3orf33 homolog [Callorhinchus milii]|uniref:protein C3orf33 homolog n=1 Tax=Callorhinchus milii TaxID=7868 RepID=UPI001C3F7636|nr:protein C3orf33 homolog [Callorhinchus milii]
MSEGRERRAQPPAAGGVEAAAGFLDRHLLALRILSPALAGAGILILARSVRLSTKFSTVLDVPDTFIQKQVQLRGKVHRITEKGLEVEHVPIALPFISSLQRKWQSSGLLMIRMAGLQMTDEARIWLQEQIKPSNIVWFQLLGREDSIIDCIVRKNKGRFFTICLNEEILRQGLGRTVAIKGLDSNSKLYWKLQTKLIKAELKAQTKGRGIWKEPTLTERITHNIQHQRDTIFQNLKNLTSWIKGFGKQ